MTTLAKDLKPGQIIKTEEGTFTVKDIKVSNIGKHGRSKCRIEAINVETKEEKILITLADQEIEVQ